MLRQIKRLSTAVAIAGVCVGAMTANASLTFNLNQGNTGPGLLPNAPGPYGTIVLSLVDSTHATVTLTADPGYTFGDGSTLGLSLASAATVVGGAGGVTLTQYSAAPSVANINYTAGQNVDGWGQFNFTVNLNGGFGNSVTALSLTLLKSSGAWTTESDILAANNKNHEVVAHAMYIADGGLTTGFATGTPDNGGGTPQVPEPSTVLAGILLALPLGASAVRILRRNASAS